jgi:hypothetical protein
LHKSKKELKDLVEEDTNSLIIKTLVMNNTIKIMVGVITIIMGDGKTTIIKTMDGEMKEIITMVDGEIKEVTMDGEIKAAIMDGATKVITDGEIKAAKVEIMEEVYGKIHLMEYNGLEKCKKNTKQMLVHFNLAILKNSFKTRLY